MADSLGSAVLTLTVDDSAYKAGLNAAKAQATSAVDGIAGAFRNLAGIVGVVGLAAFTQQVIAAGQASQKTKLQLDALTAAYGEQRQASESVARIQAVLGISATEARQGYAQLYAALRGTGVGAAQLEVLFVGLTKAAIASGASSAEASAGLLQLKQALASGRLQGDELRSVLESLPALTQALASQLGVSVGELKKLGSEGKITSDVIFEAAKKFAGQTVRAKTETENLGVAFENLKEQIAAAVGPGVIQLFAGIAAGVATFAKLVEDNAGKIKGFVVATLALGRALAPFAAAILTVRAAMVAYQVAAKAAAVAQAAVLALTGPKGWAVLAAGLGLAAGAAVTIEKTMQGVGAETKKAKEEYEKLKNEFAGILAGTNLDLNINSDATNNIKQTADARAKAEKDILAPSRERLSDLQAIAGLEGEALERAKAGLLVAKARRAEEQAIVEYNQQLAASGGNGSDPKVIEAAAKVEAAGNNVKAAFLEGGQAIEQSIRQAASAAASERQSLLQSSISESMSKAQQAASNFDEAGNNFRQAGKTIADAGRSLASAKEGAFKFLVPSEQKRLVEEARNAYSRVGSFKPLSARLSDEEVLQAGNAARSVLNAQEQYSKVSQDLVSATNALVQKDWLVNVNVQGSDASAYGDVVNGALAS